jgi:hypothetical protein
MDKANLHNLVLARKEKSPVEKPGVSKKFHLVVYLLLGWQY